MGTTARERKNYGPRGKGSISILPVAAANKSKEHWKEVKVVIFDEDGYKTVYHLTDLDELTTEFGDWNLQPVKDVYVELTPDEENIRAVRPWDGTYLLSFDRFVARQNDDGTMAAPTIKHRGAERVTIKATGQSWTNPPHDEFYAILKVRATEIGKKTEFEGMEVLKPLVYMFERNPDTGMVEIVWERKFWYNQLENFLTMTGYDWDADNLTPSENVLGELQGVLQERAEIFRGNFTRGWLDRELDNPPVGVSL